MSLCGSRFARSLIVPAVCVLALGACATAPKSTAKTPARQVLDLNRRAMRAYQSGDLANAKQLLLRAVTVGTDAGLSEHNAMARTYLNLGAVYLRMEERDRSVGHLVLAMRIQPEIEPAADLASPALKKAMAAARVQARRSAAAAAAAARRPAPQIAERKLEPKEASRAAKLAPSRAEEEAPAPAPARATAAATDEADAEEPDMPANFTKPLHCPTADEAPPQSAIPLRCVPRPGLSVARVLLYYRSAGSETFTAVPMVRSPKGWYQGVVPGRAVVGKSLQYYIEAEDPAKKVSTTNGDAGSPNLMIIREGAPKVVGQGALAGARFERRRARAAEADAEVRQEEDPLAAMEERREQEELEANTTRRSPSAFWVGAGVGSGYGWHPKRQLEFRSTEAVQTGFSPGGLLHVSPEVGMGFGGYWAVSLQSRHQIIPESGSGDDKVGAPRHSAHALLARIYRFFGAGDGQIFGTATVGVGQGFRLVVPPHPEVGVNRNDTVRGGPFVFGPGAGYLYHFTRHFAWSTEARFLFGAPDIAGIAEISTGAQLAF